MKKTVFYYGSAMAVLLVLLKVLEYRYFIRNLSVDVMMGVMATIFILLGIWMGMKLSASRHLNEFPQPSKLTASAADFSDPQNNFTAASQVGITNREMDVLGLMARGFSNQEIADQLFVSLSTVKTHSSNLFTKLEAKRRTQAVQKAKDLNIIT